MIIKDKSYSSGDSVILNNKYESWRWDIDKVTNNRKSYRISQGNPDVKVAIIDSGVDQSHPDLKSNIVISKNFVPESNSLEDNLGHGTMVAGEIAANGNVIGIAPKTSIASYKVFDGIKCESTWVINAIIQAVNDDMDVINLSLGTYKSLSNKNDLGILREYENAIEYAKSKNCVVVAASGTETKGIDISSTFNLSQKLGGKNELGIYIPAGLADVITVSATNKDDKLANYSNYGYSVGISAPAGDYGPNWENEKKIDIKYMNLATCPTKFKQSELSLSLGFKPGYEFTLGGTSIAAAKVSAAAALIISAYKEKYGVKPSRLKVENLLYKGTTPGAGGNNSLYYGNGILNVENSLKLI